MSEWVIALITGGTAVVAGAVGGWFSRSSGVKQADAARHAAEQQAEALLESVRITVRAEAAQRALDRRRHTYAAFLGAAETRLLTERTGRGEPGDDALLQRALGAVLLEAPPAVVEAAQDLVARLRRHQTPDELNRAKLVFVTAAQEDLRPDTRSH